MHQLEIDVAREHPGDEGEVEGALAAADDASLAGLDRRADRSRCS